MKFPFTLRGMRVNIDAELRPGPRSVEMYITATDRRGNRVSHITRVEMAEIYREADRRSKAKDDAIEF